MPHVTRREWLQAMAACTAAVGAGAQTPPPGPPPAVPDWPQFLGPRRDGTYAGPPLRDMWSGTGPAVLWRTPVGAGFAGAAVAQGRVLMFHREGNEEILDALEMHTGRRVWRYAYPTRYRDDFGFDEGPRAVPVVAGGVAYTFGAEGQLHAVDTTSGRRVWSVDTAARFAVPKGFFGAAGSPVVESGLVVANIGGPRAGVVAFDAKTGAVRWTATGDGASYSSGVAATLDGMRTLLFLTRDNLLGLDPATGTVRFSRRWRARQAASVNAATPVVVGDLVFVSSEYGPGAAVLQVRGSMLTERWASDEVLSTHYATAVHHGGYLYGFHGRQEFGPSFRAVEFETGRVAWSEDGFRAGSVVLAGDRLLVLRESGELLLAPASPRGGLKPVARAQIMQGIVRPHMAVANGLVYARNDNTLLCLDLRR